MYVYLNGSIVSEEDARISVFDHGFLYGDGVFEGIRAYEEEFFVSTSISIVYMNQPNPS